MSTLQKSIMKAKLPPRIPRTAGISKLAPFGGSRRKDYSPVPWKEYFEKSVDVKTDGGTFRVYLTPEPDNHERPRIVTLHGGGYSGLSWALFAQEITNMIHCQVVSIDIRGHGETKTNDDEDLGAETLVKDVEQVIHKLYGSEIPPLVLLGHSMGGAVAVRTAQLASLEHCLQGVAVIDVVEGTAMEALASMQSFLRGRPTHFRTIEHAIEWCVRSGQVRNVESARVSMPSQILNCESGLLAINEVEDYVSEGTPAPTAVDSIAEEGEPDTCLKPAGDAIPEEGVPGTFLKPAGDKSGLLAINEVDVSEGTPAPTAVGFIAEEGEPVSGPGPGLRPVSDTCRLKPAGDAIPEEGVPETFLKPAGDNSGNMKYKWRIDLSKTERHWSGWFKGLSSLFLSAAAPRLLLLASIDGLDRELTVGQMQGKFQMQVLARCGHAVHEDMPGEVARVVASFALRHRLTSTTEAGEHMHLNSSMPGC